MHVAEPRLGGRVGGMGRGDERAPMSGATKALADAGPVLRQVRRWPPRVDLRVVGVPHRRAPWLAQPEAERELRREPHRDVAHERPDEHEGADDVRVFGGRPHRRPRSHRVADEDRRAPEVLGKRHHVGAGSDVVVARERGVAVSVPAQIHRRDPVAGLDEARGQEAVHRSKVAETRCGHDERTLSRDVVGDPSLGPLQVLGGRRAGGRGAHHVPLLLLLPVG